MFALLLPFITQIATAFAAAAAKEIFHDVLTNMPAIMASIREASTDETIVKPAAPVDLNQGIANEINALGH